LRDENIIINLPWYRTLVPEGRKSKGIGSVQHLWHQNEPLQKSDVEDHNVERFYARFQEVKSFVVVRSCAITACDFPSFEPFGRASIHELLTDVPILTTFPISSNYRPTTRQTLPTDMSDTEHFKK